MATISLEEAAKRAGLSRWTVARALKSGHLAGMRDNRQRWRIDADALEAWAKAQARTVQHEEQPRAAVQVGNPERDVALALAERFREERDQSRLEEAGLRVEVAQVRQQMEQLREQMAELRADRDRWHKHATRSRLEWARGLFGRKTVEG